jgi:hypothetical protein
VALVQFGSLCEDRKSKPRMGFETAASRKVTKKERRPKERQRLMEPELHGMSFPSAPKNRRTRGRSRGGAGGS